MAGSGTDRHHGEIYSAELCAAPECHSGWNALDVIQAVDDATTEH